MAITPADIEKKTFSTALRGYDLDEVDDFLDEMVVAVRELETELTQARVRIAELERDPAAPAPAPAPVAATGPDESAVGRALVAAQVAADRLLEEARLEADRKLAETQSEADRILEGARTEADTFVRDRDEKKAAIEAEMAQLNSLVAGVRTRLAMLATSVADKLDEMDAVVAGSLVADHARPEADLTDEEPSEGLSFTADEEIGFDTIDLGGDGEVEAEVEVNADEELSAESDIDDVVEAELDLDADEDHEATDLTHIEGLVDADDGDDDEADEEA